MAKNSTISATLVAIVAAAMIFGGANAASPVGAPGPSQAAVPAPSPGADCLSYLLNMSDCLSYVEQGSNLTKPEKACCPEVKSLLELHPICLCELLAHPDQSPIPIDLPKAVGLPSVCKLDLPFGTPASGCAALGVPIGALAPGPGGPAPSSGATLSPQGLASSPASPHNRNDGRSIAASQRRILVGLATVLFASLF